MLTRYHAVLGGATGFVSLRKRRGMAYNARRFSPRVEL